MKTLSLHQKLQMTLAIYWIPQKLGCKGIAPTRPLTLLQTNTTEKAAIALLTDSIKALNLLGIYDYESQSEVTSQQYAIALSKGDERAIKRLADQLKIIGEYGSAYMSVRENLYIQREQLNLLKKKFEEAKIDAEAVLTYKFIVNKAFPAERKSYPVRWLIVATSTIASIVLGILVLILLDNIKRIRKQGGH